MLKKALLVAAFAVTGAALLLSPGGARAENVFEAVPDGVKAYIYGYPLVTMEMTRRVMTNVEKPEGTRAPMGQFVRMRGYPTAAFRDVTAPNADTLYTTAWIDVKREPWVLTLPDAHDRYYLFPMLDGWTEVFQVPGKRTTGTGRQVYAITGPGWKGKLPNGVKQYQSPTSMVWLLGRIYCTGTPEDYAEVHKLQDQISLVPLSAYGKPYTPPRGKVDRSVDMHTAVREQVNALSADQYFNLLARLMKDNPPAAADQPMLAKMAKIGIVPGKPFDSKKLPLAKDIPKIANEKIMLWLKEGIVTGDMKVENGWAFTTKAGIYGTDYVQRALVTAIGLGANRPQDAIYPTSEGPSIWTRYTGEKKYVMHFDQGMLPPVKGFWSLTMYDKEYFFVQNPINRQSISARQALKPNADGSVDLYIQNENPGPEKEANWLPAPKDQFILMMRLYWPSEEPPSIIDGTWKIPPVKAVE
ncbi:DUF1254 domain-containing protein [Geomonas sp.]|uniref:DUF1254 domain-containing protein n=1 Tax=Geomonas sp. TaxID=2651584 RepID=UPI002B47669E|nr:DUF1254 domain-containing protein [Geomonas sp.]HJV33589.1 DUF1254 domain-containing protein [Geomonas sp.]